jgi:hypothetical protein
MSGYIGVGTNLNNLNNNYNKKLMCMQLASFQKVLGLEHMGIRGSDRNPEVWLRGWKHLCVYRYL